MNCYMLNEWYACRKNVLVSGLFLVSDRPVGYLHAAGVGVNACVHINVEALEKTT